MKKIPFVLAAIAIGAGIGYGTFLLVAEIRAQVAQRQLLAASSRLVGKKLPFAEITLTRPSLVMALSVNCRYCAASASFYRELGSGSV